MTQAVTARRDGDTFQARLFWLRAARLLDPESAIVRVGFESGPKGFDDIWVEYDPSRSASDQYGDPLHREHIQCKWHVTPDSYGYTQLVDPEFIHASARSLLQRAREAQLAHAPDGVGVRFTLMTNWTIDHADPLREMIGNRSGAIRLDRLYKSATDRSRAGRMRKVWREHLGINEDELRLLARTLAFHTTSETLDTLRENLDMVFGCVGLRREPPNKSSFTYDDVVFQWMAQGRQEFDRASFRSICAKEGLLGDAEEQPRAYGVKSFEHPIDRLEERCRDVLNLVPAFDERYIRSDTDWQADLYPALRAFLLGAAKDKSRLRLALDAHTTLAFAAGSVLNVKSGRKIELEQRTAGRHLWAADDMPSNPDWPRLCTAIEELNADKPDLAVAIGITHDISADVRRYIDSFLPTGARLAVLTPTGGASSQAVAGGRHASDLAETTFRAIRSARVNAASSATIHIFIAAPNAFTFFLGQRQPGLGRVRLYEFDFEGGRHRTYTPSLTLPISAKPPLPHKSA